MGVYVPPSPYPFVLRDIALFVPEGYDAAAVMDIIRAHCDVHLRQVQLFDTFTKDGRVSYAFRLVFQSDERTLDDATVTQYMEPIYAALKAMGGEVR